MRNLLSRFVSPLSVLFLAMLVSCKKNDEPAPSTKLTDRWEKMADIGGKRDFGFNFAANGKGYVGAGSLTQKDFWEYDPISNTWTQKQDFKGEPRVYSTGFGVGSKGYVTGGSGNGAMFKDVWEYDPATNNWTQKNDFNSGERFAAVSFTIGSKGYVGTGGIISSSTVLKDFWEYNPTNDLWTKKADLPSEPRVFSFGFAIGSKGYIGGGVTRPSGVPQQTLYEYNVGLDQWTQKSNSPQEADFSFSSNSFASASKGYVSGGLGKQLWQFDPATNTWTRKADPPTQIGGIGFTIGDYGYLGASYEKTFYRYTPE
jgi:N-acetylneuraminic acid mutarotase